MKRFLLFIWPVFLLLLMPPLYAQESPGELCRAEGIVLVAEQSGKVLYERNSRRQLYPASTTKIMTALLALEHAGPGEKVTVGEEIQLVGQDSSVAGLAAGDEISVEDLIHALLIPSGNDAAYTTAVYIARRASGRPDLPACEAVTYFCGMMNDRARRLEALQTHFINPDGYHHPDHYSTAFDLALIAREALKHDLFRRVVQTPAYEAKITRNKELYALTWQNTNLLLHRESPYYYSRATGLKTGYTPEAGSNLVAAATDGELDLVAVLLNSTSDERWQEAVNLFEYGFSNFEHYRLVNEGQAVASIAVTGQARGERTRVPALAAAGFEDVFATEEIPRIEKVVTWESRLLSGKKEPALKAPLTEREVVGQVSYTLNGAVLFTTELLSGASIKARFPWERIALPVLLLAALIILVKRRRSAARFRRRSRF